MLKTEKIMWTIAFRNPRASFFHRIADWEGAWAQAKEVAAIYGELHPELQVYYTTSLAYETAERIELPQRVARGEITQELANDYLEDHGNILVDSGRRVKVRD